MTGLAEEALAALQKTRGQVGAAAGAAARKAAGDGRSSPRPSISRRMGVVQAVNAGPPPTADVAVGGVTIPGLSPQVTYRPQAGDIVWVELAATDGQISPPVASAANFGWTAPALVNSWADFGAPWATSAYYRDPAGWVHLRGTLGGGNTGTTMFTLPGGYRPPADLAFPCIGSSFGLMRLVVQAAGPVQYAGPSAPAFAHLDGIRFRID